MPLTLGHENAGTGAAIGDGVRAVKEGDRVAGAATDARAQGGRSAH
jgi:D-arabinose 1-dehydrogenase-like Zn-dependent alcohol dehydrogenase